MSSFSKNLQKILVYLFSAISIIIVIIGVGRAKKNTILSITPSPAPADTGNTQSTQGTQTVIPTSQTTTTTGQQTVAVAKNSSSAVSGSFKGNAYQTPWGNAVAGITVVNGKITGVTMPSVPPSPPSQYAEPYLVAQALAAGSANIQGVSGATYTSIAFKSSLESAIAKANTTATSQGQQTVVTPAASTVTNTATTNTTAAPAVPRRYHRDEYDD